MKKILLVLPLIASVWLGGCATNKGVVDLNQVNDPITKITIIRDSETRESVLPVLEKWFTDNSIKFSVVNSINETKKEDKVLTYRAWWSWDMALYMRKADLKVLSEGEPVGIVRFDALQYGGFGKFGDAETRLTTLMDVLFSKITREEANIRLGK